MSKINWNDENTARLVELAGTGVVSQDALVAIAEEMGTTTRSIGAKLRNLGHEVESSAAKPSAWSDDEVAELVAILEANDGVYTYADLAAVFQDGKFNAKQVQGKVLSLELTAKVRKAEKKVAPRNYTPEEEVAFVEMVNGGGTIEQLSAKFGRPVNSIRGKALSLLKAGQIEKMPTQETSAAKAKVDALEGLDIASMTVEQVAEATGKSVRGIKSMLSRRGVSCADYDGASRREKLDKAE